VLVEVSNVPKSLDENDIRDAFEDVAWSARAGHTGLVVPNDHHTIRGKARSAMVPRAFISFRKRAFWKRCRQLLREGVVECTSVAEKEREVERRGEERRGEKRREEK
jgi:hypothetical protein